MADTIRKIKRASIYKRRWRARRKAAALGIPVPAIPPRRVTRARRRQLKAARAKSEGRPPIPDPKPNSVRMRASRARKRSEAREAKRLARAAQKAAHWAIYSKTLVRSNKEKAAAAAQAVTVAAQTVARAATDAKATITASWCAPQINYAQAIAFVQREIVPAQPQAAQAYIASVQRECDAMSLNLNLATLRRDGIKDASTARATVYQEMLFNNGDLDEAVRAILQNRAERLLDGISGVRLALDAQMRLAQGSDVARAIVEVSKKLASG